jgi:penicillin-binding protein 1B
MLEIEMKKARLIPIFFLLGISGAISVACFGYFFSLNKKVQDKFSGQLWELPARVYARPLELYPSMALSPDMLENELTLMAYQKTGRSDELDVPGKYLRKNNFFEIFCRPFDFGDEKISERRLGIRIEHGKIVKLQNSLTRLNKEMERLDPVIVGSFYPVSREDRILVESGQIPSLLVETIICVEDRSFYTHSGVDLKSIVRAMLVNIKNRRMIQGAGTITQQLARNFFLSREKTLIRKINELFMAVILELNHSKEDILEAYVNEVYLGQDGSRAVHGFGLAAVFYFGKSLRDLQIHEMALLVGMLKGPSYYNPRKYPVRIKQRRDIILKMMGEQQLISEIHMKKALESPLDIIKKPVQGYSPFPYYLDLVKRRLLQEYRETDLRSMGLRIFTTLDPQIQLAAEQSVASRLKQIAIQKGLSLGSLEAGVVVTATGSNEVQALVGGKNSRYGGFNRALDARRPIGSLVKPAVFLSALSQPETYTLITRVDDGPVKVSSPDGSQWVPKNFDTKYHGQVKLYQALVNSYNAATVRLGMDIGLGVVLETLRKMGYEKEITAYPSVLLGSIEMSPFQVAQIYHTLSSGGFFTPVRSIRAIYRADGRILQRFPLTIEQHFDPGVVFLLNKMLQAVVMEGTAKSLKKWLSKDLGIAGKTGTTNDMKDSWFAGFSGNRLAVVWVGRDDNQSARLTGSAGALQIFGHLMSRISIQPLSLLTPENVEWAVIDPETGFLTHKSCPNAMTVPFIKGSVPSESVPCRPAMPHPTVPNKKTKKPRYLIDWLKEVFK